MAAESAEAAAPAPASAGGRRKEIYTYQAPWALFGMNWAVRGLAADNMRLAVGSFVEEYTNKVQLLRLNMETHAFEKLGEFDHPYPTTKIMWSPDTSQAGSDILATTGDYLRIWHVTDHGVRMEALLNNNRNTEYCAPLTGFDWNRAEPATIGTSSIDSTCSIWDITTGQSKTQLIAHDKEVFDIAFAPDSPHMFASVGADGSVRLFDLRSLEHSTIVYETQGLVPLLRLGWNNLDQNYLATILVDSPRTVIVDVRMPSVPVAELGGDNSGHQACVNSFAWAPHSSAHICTAGDDSLALIWDLSEMPRSIEDPILAYNAAGEVNQLQWARAQPDWVAITYGDSLQVLRV